MIALKWLNSKKDPIEQNGINRRDSVVIDEENSETEVQTSIPPCWRKNLGWIILLVVVILGIIGISLVAIYLNHFPATVVATKDLDEN